MGSAGRPPRRARSAKVLYEDSASEDEEDESLCVAHQPILPSDRVRKNLALKRASRSQECAEALQIQKAIDKSLLQEKLDVNGGSVAPDAAISANEIVDSEEEGPNIPGCMELEAGAGSPQGASNYMSHEKALEKEAILDEIPIPSSEIVNKESSGQGIDATVNSKEIKTTVPLNADKKALKGAAEKDEDWSSEEEDDDEEDFTDDGSSDASEDLKHKKKKRQLNSQQKGRKAVGHTGKQQNSFAAHVKKPRSSRTLPEARAAHVPAKKGLPSSGNAMKPSKPANVKEKSPASNTSEDFKKHLMNSKERKENGRRGVSSNDCKTTIVEHRNSPSAILYNKASQPTENAACESSGILGFSAQSPTGLHRRVLGLSRRFKPPPLHPYLPKLEG